MILNQQRLKLTARRAVLIEQAAAQRRLVAQCVQPWRAPIGYVDRGMELLRRIRAHPLALVTGVLLLFRLGRGRLSVWAGRAWTGWQIYQSLQVRRSPPRE